MKYIKKYESFEVNKEWKDASKEEVDKDIMGEDDIDFIITKIQENFPKEDIKSKIESGETDAVTIMIDMICWFEDKYRDVSDEDVVLDKLKSLYDI